MIDYSKNIDKKFILCLILYLSLHVLFRLIISSSLEHDEAEMILLSQQSFQLGYNSQPPLYAWLQLAFFSIFGLNIFSLTFLKHLLIFIMYFFIYKSAWEITKNQLYAVFSAISLFLVYNFEWIFHKDLTHTVLLMTICALSFYAFLKLLSQRKLKYYILFGVFIGLGFLSKYNYCFFIIPLLLAAISIERFRPAILNKNILFSFIIASLITAPHFYWCLIHKDSLMIDQYKFYTSENNTLSTSLRALFLLMKFSFYFVALLTFFYLLFFKEGFIRLKIGVKDDNSFKQLLERFFCFGFIFLLILILFFKVINVENRWVLPILFLLPTYFFTRLTNFKISSFKKKLFLFIVCFAALSIVMSISGRVVFSYLGRKCVRWNLPYQEISQMIKKDGFDKGLIITENFLMGGDLKINFKDSLVITTKKKIPHPDLGNFSKKLILWEGDMISAFPEELNDLLRELKLKPDIKLAVTRKVLYKYSKDKYYTVSYVITSRD